MNLSAHFRSFFLIAGLSVLTACSIVPREGPMSKEIEQQSVEDDYVVIDVTADIVNGLAAFNPVGLQRQFKSTRYRLPISTVGAGDVLSIAIFEAAEGGLFSGGDKGNRAEFPMLSSIGRV